MKKKLLIGFAVLAAIVVAFLYYETQIAAKKSPSKTTSFNAGDLDISVTYCQPSVRGRQIFGEEKDGALQPYGEYWRLGANAATEITFSKDISFAGQPVNAGTYRMYAVPGKENFQVFLNSELGVRFSAASEPDHTKDVLKVDAPVSTTPEPTEMFTINFSNDSTGVRMDFVWDRTQFTVPISRR